MRIRLIAIALLATTTQLVAAPPPKPITAAVAFKGRPAAATALDANRKPAEVLAFEGLKPGMKAFDLLTGGGYYAEIMGHAVGAKGSVIAYAPAGYNEDKTKAAFVDIATRAPNVTMTNAPATAFAPAAYDFAMIHLNYHDFYWESEKFKIPRTDPNQVLGALFRAMKPGGIVAVIDHVGPAGDTRALVEQLHRIDPETVKADFARAGFVLDGTSDVLRVASDDHSKNVFDPAIKGATDRFVFRFKKPR